MTKDKAKILYVAVCKKRIKFDIPKSSGQFGYINRNISRCEIIKLSITPHFTFEIRQNADEVRQNL